LGRCRARGDGLLLACRNSLQTSSECCGVYCGEERRLLSCGGSSEYEVASGRGHRRKGCEAMGDWFVDFPFGKVIKDRMWETNEQGARTAMSCVEHERPVDEGRFERPPANAARLQCGREEGGST